MWQKGGSDGQERRAELENVREEFVRYRSGNSSVDGCSNLRVNKWDAMVLDSEILGLFKFPIKKMFALSRPGLMEQYQPEIDAVVFTLMFFLSVGMKQVYEINALHLMVNCH